MPDRKPAPQWVPRGLRLPEAALYVGFGRTKFLEMVAAGRMPPSKRDDGCRVWDRLALDDAFEALPDDAPAAGASPAADSRWDGMDA